MRFTNNLNNIFYITNEILIILYLQFGLQKEQKKCLI
jgi:hypothetical protein